MRTVHGTFLTEPGAPALDPTARLQFTIACPMNKRRLAGTDMISSLFLRFCPIITVDLGSIR